MCFTFYIMPSRATLYIQSRTERAVWGIDHIIVWYTSTQTLTLEWTNVWIIWWNSKWCMETITHVSYVKGIELWYLELFVGRNNTVFPYASSAAICASNQANTLHRDGDDKEEGVGPQRAQNRSDTRSLSPPGQVLQKKMLWVTFFAQSDPRL